MSVNLVSLLTESGQRYGDQALFGAKVDGVMRWTSYARFEADVAGYTERLAALGVVPGDRVVVAGAWSLAAAQLAHAVCWRCASFVTLGEVTDGANWRLALRQTEARWVLASSPRVVRTLENLTLDLHCRIQIIEPGLSVAAHPAKREAVARLPRPDELAARCYRRAASGQLSATLLTHRALCSSATSIRHTSGMRRRAITAALLLRGPFGRAAA
jgi:long-subunit acyl-CoA synthetase (AMP-forming)